MKNSGFWRMLPVVAALLLAGCVTEEKPAFFVTQYGATRNMDAAATTEPLIFAGSGNPHVDILRMYADGYALVGYSMFPGARGDFQPEKQQATTIAATYVLVSAQRDAAIPSLKPMTTATTPETYERGTYGDPLGTLAARLAGKPASANPETPTAFYYVPLEPRGVGIWLADANERDKQRAGGTKAPAVFLAIRKGSAADKAGFLPGDVATTHDGIEFDGPDALIGYLAIAKGRDIAVGVLRGNQRRVISLPVPADYQ